MKSIYVVVEERGDYSDYRMEVLCWFDCLEEAEDEVKKLQETVSERDSWDCPSYSSIELPHGTTLAGKKLE